MHFILPLLIACGGGEPQAPTAAPTTTAPQRAEAPPAAPAPEIGDGKMNVQALDQRMGKEIAIIVDVRTPGEFAQGHVHGAVNIPLQEIKARKAELESYKDKEVAVICAVGGRSATAAQYLQTEGYEQVYNVLGGTRAWVAAGYPVEQ